MSPIDKLVLIKSLQGHKGRIVGMCGEGSNDIQAIKASHIGVSIGQGEASICAEFTSKSDSIDCCVRVIQEGKASVETMLQSFKTTQLYALIQLF